jgi:hypothetical protein
MIVIWCYICRYYMLCLNYVEFHLLVLRKNEHMMRKLKVLVCTTSVHPSNVGPPKGGPTKMLGRKKCFELF